MSERNAVTALPPLREERKVDGNVYGLYRNTNFGHDGIFGMMN